MPLIYDQTATTLNEGYSDVYQSGMLISASSSLIGQVIETVEVYLSRSNTVLANTISCYIINSSGTTVETIGTMSASSITTGITLETFTNPSASHVLAAGDRLVIGWGQVTGPNLNYLRTWRSNSSVVSHVAFQFQYPYLAGSTTGWQPRVDNGDLACKIYSSTASSGGPRLPPEPIVVHF